MSPVFVGKAKMMDDPVFVYFSQNIEAVSKEELLEALRGALESSYYWREACLLGFPQLRVNVATDHIFIKDGYTV